METPAAGHEGSRLITGTRRAQALRKAIFAVADGVNPVVDLSRIYVDGLENLPVDGRFLLVGNHTSSGFPEIVLIPYFVHRHLGVRVRGLATRSVGNAKGLLRDFVDAVGAVPGQPDVGAELMRHGETMLVFPGGGRDMLKFKGEEYKLHWEGRSGFARLAIAHDYPIVPVGLVGGDDVYLSLVERDGTWERMSRTLGERVHGLSGVGIPLSRGLGPTFLPRPQRMYVRFGQPISTSQPEGVESAQWESTVKDTSKNALETVLAELQALRGHDPFRSLNPLQWRKALMP